MSIEDKKYRIFLDIETTGLDCSRHEILEIAVVKELIEAPYNAPGIIVEEWCRKIAPRKIGDADPDALRVNGYLQQTWDKEAVSFVSIADELYSLLSSGKIIGQNPNFDLGFIAAEYNNIGIKPTFIRYAIDTTTCSYMAWGLDGACNLSMDSMRNFCGIDKMKAHTALKDALDCRTIFYKSLAQTYNLLIRADKSQDCPVFYSH